MGTGAYAGPNWALAGLKAGADLSAAAKQFTFVKLDANGDVVAVSGITDEVIGVLYDRPASGQAAEVRVGQVEVQANGALNEGAAIGTSSDGQAQAAASTNRNLGYALTAASGAGVRFSAWIMPTGAIVA
jgi:hypothetical protein